MPIDEQLLKRHRCFEHPEAGFREEFVQPVLGLGSTVGVLSRPLGEARSVGWVICHSFGIEQIHLGRLDVIVARALSAAGFPVFRFHGQGYGDAQGGMEVVGLASHLAEATEAVEFARRHLGVDSVGTLGARFGGTVAALVADRMDLPFLGLWEPLVSGTHYMKDYLRTQILADIVENGQGGGAADVEGIRNQLSTEGWADIRGFHLTRQAYDDIAAVDLVADLRRFGGTALLVGLSRSGRLSKSLTAFVGHMQGLAAACSVELVEDPAAAQFGQFRWRTVDGGQGKRDGQLELNEKISDATVAWARSQAGESVPSVEARP